MSFILESIKQAERERNAGKAPVISVEYVPTYANDYEGSWKNWLIASLGLILLIMVSIISINIFSHNDAATVSKVDELPANYLVEEIPMENKVNDSTSDQSKLSFIKSDNIHNSTLRSVNIVDKDFEQETTFSLAHDDISEIEKSPVTLEKQEKSSIAESIETKVSVEDQIISSEIETREELVVAYSELSNKDAEMNSLIVDQIEYLETEDLPKLVTVITEQEAPKLQKAIDTGIVDFGQLPHSVQEQIPDLGISVHMFHEEPLLRKIRINGRMYTENSQMLPNLELVEITRYGAIFNYDGHSFKVNVR